MRAAFALRPRSGIVTAATGHVQIQVTARAGGFVVAFAEG